MGLYVTADNVAISKLTVDAGNVTYYGIKVNPADALDPEASLTGFSMESVDGQGRGQVGNRPQRRRQLVAHQRDR